MNAPALTMERPEPRVVSFGPRVLFVVPGEAQGSSMIFVRRQAHSLVAEGVRADLYFLSSRTSPQRLLAEFHRFRAELRRLRPQVVHAHFGTMTAAFAALGCGSLPLVVTYRGSDLNPPPVCCRGLARVRARCGCLLSQLAALRARQIVCVSRQLRDRLWWRRAVVRILPTGVDPAMFHPEPRARARQRLGWAEGETVVLFNAGHDARGKRLDLAQAAFARARRQMPALRLEILDGSVAPARVPALMNASDCLLLTSFSEGSPTVVQEALACDLPIVSVDVGDVVERLEGVRDSTVALAEPAVLARALLSMVNPPRRSNGSLKVAEFSQHGIALQLKEIYQQLAGA
jgi:teichuronic acid biosynthesis glycosyltransferase TuaC